MIAEYECDCEEKWSAEIDPAQNKLHTDISCPACGSIYFRWVNFEEKGKS